MCVPRQCSRAQSLLPVTGSCFRLVAGGWAGGWWLGRCHSMRAQQRQPLPKLLAGLVASLVATPHPARRGAGAEAAAGAGARAGGLLHGACAACVFTKLNRNNARNCNSKYNYALSATTIKCQRLQKRLNPDPCSCSCPWPYQYPCPAALYPTFEGLTNQTKAPPPMPPYFPVCLTACGSTRDLGCCHCCCCCIGKACSALLYCVVLGSWRSCLP